MVDSIQRGELRSLEWRGFDRFHTEQGGAPRDHSRSFQGIHKLSGIPSGS
jgi:hypothetical protein